MSNQHLRDDVLFKTPKGQPITELSLRGNKLALYTEDPVMYQRFREWSLIIYQVKYTQGWKKENLIAVDLYFPLGAKMRLLRALSVPKAAGSIS